MAAFINFLPAHASACQALRSPSRLGRMPANERQNPVPPLDSAFNGGLHSERVTGDTICFEGVDVKYKKGVKIIVQLQIEETPNYLAARFTGAGAPEED